MIKIATFNISGGFYLGNEDNEYLDREAVDNIDNELLKQIIDTINQENLDIICFQEIITTERINYLETVKNNTNLKYYDYYELSECNTVKNTNCGIAIFSKYPIDCIKKDLFPNPHLSKTTDSGNTYYTFDKGYMICNIDINNKKISVLNHHGFPYARFNSTPMDNKDVFSFFDNVIDLYKPNIVIGDFNAEDFMPLMDKTSKIYKRTINDITTVNDKKYDDILVNKDINASKKIIKLLSDHFIVIDEIEGII